MRRNKRKPARAKPSSRGQDSFDSLAGETIDAINDEVEWRFSDSARLLLTDERWARHVRDVEDTTQPFAWAYGELLSNCVADHADFLTQAILASRARRKPTHWVQIVATSMRFAERLAEKECVDRWLALFVQHHLRIQDANELPDWLSGAPPFLVALADLPEVKSIAWKAQAVEKAKHRIRIRALLLAPPIRNEKTTEARLLDFESVAKTRSFSYPSAAAMFRCDPHTIQRWVREGKLTRASRGRVKNDPKFMKALYKLHGIPQTSE